MKTIFLLLAGLISIVGAQAATLLDAAETTNPGNGSWMWVVDPNEAHPQDRRISIPNLRTEMGLSTLSAAESLWSVNVLTETEIDASDELRALMDDETGTGGGLVFATSPTLSDTTITGSLLIPNGASPVTDATGELALDTTITDHKSLLQYDGGADEMLVIALPRGNLDNTDGDVVKYNAATDSFVMSPDNDSGGSTAFNDIGDTTDNGSVGLAHTNIWTFSLDGSKALYLLSSDADNASDTVLLHLGFNDSADANSIFLDMYDDADGTPRMVYEFAADGFTSIVPVSIGTGNGQIDVGSTGVRVTSDGDGALTFLGLGDGSDEDLTVNFDDTANTISLSSSTGVTDLDLGTIDLNTDTIDLTGTGTLNGLDAIDGTTETTLEGALDIAGEVTSTGMGSTVIADNLTVSGWTFQGTTTVGTLAGAIDAGGATSFELPNGNDVDVDAEGEFSWDANGDNLRGFDGTRQVSVARAIQAIHVTVVSPNDLADSERDAFWIWENTSGMSFVITGWSFKSDTDDTTLNIEEIDNDGANNTTVDAVEIATNGTGLFYATDTTITAATIENGHLIVLDFDDSDTPGQVKGTIYGYFDADVN